MNVIKSIMIIMVAVLICNSQEQDSVAQTECFPPCREGYFCLEGNCIEKCNPPCPAGMTCTKSGECEPIKTTEVKNIYNFETFHLENSKDKVSEGFIITTGDPETEIIINDSIFGKFSTLYLNAPKNNYKIILKKEGYITEVFKEVLENGEVIIIDKILKKSYILLSPGFSFVYFLNDKNIPMDITIPTFQIDLSVIYANHNFGLKFITGGIKDTTYKNISNVKITEIIAVKIIAGGIVYRYSGIGRGVFSPGVALIIGSNNHSFGINIYPHTQFKFGRNLLSFILEPGLFIGSSISANLKFGIGFKL